MPSYISVPTKNTDESGQYSTNGSEPSMALTDSVSGHNTYKIESKCNKNSLIYSYVWFHEIEYYLSETILSCYVTVIFNTLLWYSTFWSRLYLMASSG